MTTTATHTVSSLRRAALGALVLLCGLPAVTRAAAPSAAAVSEAQQIFKSRCVMCHGETGKGDGAAAAALNPKPRDLSSAEWQKSVTDEHIEKIIREGGPAVGKSPLMPPNPDLADKPEVVKGLRSLVRSQGA